MRTVDAARGRWREILPIIGISPTFLRNVHGPCPLCGGRDRFRFDDKDGAGTYFCSQCGAGDGVTLVRRLKGWDFPTAAKEIDRILGTRSAPAPRPKPAPNLAAREHRLRETLRKATYAGIVDAYLSSRGISVRSPALRGGKDVALYDDDRRLVGYFDAVLAPICHLDKSLASVAAIYLDPSFEKGRKKKFLPKISTINGAAIRLFPVVDVLAITEGIENALAFHELTGLPTWAALSANGVRAFEPPVGLRRLVIAGDYNTVESQFAGQRAAQDLAERLWRDRKFEAEIRLPPEPGVDWNEMLRMHTASGGAG